MIKRLGAGTLMFENRPRIAGYASVVGRKEAEGPLCELFDKIYFDSRGEDDTYEAAESRLQREAARIALEKSGLRAADMDCVFAGDLLNQCVGSTFGMMGFGVPYLGQYGACSTMGEGLALAALMVDGGYARRAAAMTSSHFCTAERQYRFPLEYGAVRTPTSQWTVTGAGSCVLSESGSDIGISAATIGRIVDLSVTDANNMGAAMAPAAADTIMRFLHDTGTSPQDYDRIFTGDLGMVGSELLYDLLEREGFADFRGRHDDCGLLIYNREEQDVHAGGSGCGCCASVLCTRILGDLARGALHNVLFIATGALLSTTTSGQGKSIPAVAHLLRLQSDHA